jgi:predicted P-loop ATPase
MNELVGLIEQKTGYPPQQRGDGYQARCPAHTDESPSLSIKRGDKQPWVLYCHAGCSHSDIMAALGVAPPSVNGNGNGAAPIPANGQLAKRPAKPKLGQLVATYPYHDTSGRHIFTKNRYNPKTFRLVSATGQWGLQGATPTLYNADLIASSDPETVPIFIVEGEKDADNLGLFMDWLATCNYDGAGKWSSDYTALLAGRHVVIIPDNDEPGEKHAQMVADAVTGTAASVRVVRLDGLPPHGDISDYLAAGTFNPAALWQAVEDAPPLVEKPKDFSTDAPKTEDYRKALRWLGYAIRWNELTDTVELNSRPIDDVSEATLRSKMQDVGMRGVTRMNDAVLVEANDNRYHPIREYLDTLVWNGEDWIGKLFNIYINEDTGFGETAWKRWMIGAVAKVYVQAQNAMLVWDGGQDVGKSHLARWLSPLPEYYIEAQLNPDDKDSLVRLATRFIWEVPEVDATTRRAEVAALKDFITRETITVRRAYAKYDMVKPACASLIGTINSDGAGFLRDTTGNRRFLTIRMSRIDWSYSEIDVSNLWAQAVAMFRNGEPWRLTASEREMRDTINQQYQTQNYLEVLFDKFFVVRPERLDEWLTAEQIMKELEMAGLKGSQNQNLKDLKGYLHKLGATVIRPRLANGTRPTAYAGVSPNPDNLV